MSSITAGTTSTTTLIHSGDTTGSLVFKTNDTGSGGTTAMTIDTSQNVGIGTTSPTGKIYSNAPNTTSIGVLSEGGLNIGNTNGSLIGRRNNLNFACLSSNTNAVATIAFEYTNQGGTSGYGDLLFATRNVNTDTAPSERMRINSSGNLLVGATSASLGGVTAGSALFYSSANYAVMIRVPSGATNQALRFFNGSTAVGSVDCSGTATAYNTSSDYRLKENVAPMTGALAKVAQLKPVTYKWKLDGSDGEGFIAHELAEVCPHAVNGEKDAVDADGNPVYQGIDTSFLVATLTAAIKELKAINDQQAETINALTARIVALEGQ